MLPDAAHSLAVMWSPLLHVVKMRARLLSPLAKTGELSFFHDISPIVQYDFIYASKDAHALLFWCEMFGSFRLKHDATDDRVSNAMHHALLHRLQICSGIDNHVQLCLSVCKYGK
jgi:hypothetical protein